MKIYICGGSTELDEVASRIRQLRELGHTITYDWVTVVRANGGVGNPRSATYTQRLRWSDDNIQGVETANIVWAILPKQSSFGCAFEIGCAIGCSRPVIVSGDWRATIFSSQALARFDEHDRAVEWLKLFVTPGSWDAEMNALEAK